MSYPSPISNLIDKTDGLGQIIYADHINDIHTALRGLNTVLGDAPQGNLSDLQSRLEVLTNSDGKIIGLGNVVFVGKEGFAFSTIQSAIDSITTQSISNIFQVLVFPGVYEETVTLKHYVSVYALSNSVSSIFSGTYYCPTTIKAPAGQNAIAGSYGDISNFKIFSSQSQPAITQTTGSFRISNCLVHTSGSGNCVNFSGTTLLATGCTFIGEDSIPIVLSGGNHMIERSTIEDAGGYGSWTLSNGATIKLLFSAVSDQNGAPPVPSGCKCVANFTAFTSYPSGAGTVTLGTMSGTCGTLNIEP